MFSLCMALISSSLSHPNFVHTAEYEGMDGALDQLQSKQGELLNVIDELKTIGLACIVESPQFIVCGDRASGKSSVLEAISHVRFPVGTNVCTRFATEIILRRNPSPHVKITIEPGPSRTDEQEQQRLRDFPTEGFASVDDLPWLIEKAKEWMGISKSVNSGFSDDILKVEIAGPDKPDVTLVDLPGLFHSISDDQGPDGVPIVHDLVQRYMKDTRSIILAIITAKSECYLQEVLDVVEHFDPERERTLGIITHPDLLKAHSEEEDTYLQYVRNEKIRLQLGWHALKNRSLDFEDLPDDARDAHERAFFNSGRWAGVSRELVGVDSLRRRMSSILLNHMKHDLPDLIADINERISERLARLTKLGDARSTPQQQRGYLLRVSSGFERLIRQALSGMYTDDFFGGLSANASDQDPKRLRAVVRDLNDQFAEAMHIGGCRRRIIHAPVDARPPSLEVQLSNQYLSDWTPITIHRADLEDEMDHQCRLNRGIELPGNANQLLVGNLFRDQSQPWEGLANRHLLTVCDAVRHFVELLLQHLVDERTYPVLMSTVLDPELERLKDNLLEKLQELNAYNKRGHPLPLGERFAASIAKIESDRQMALLEIGQGRSSNTTSWGASQVLTPSDRHTITSDIGSSLAAAEVVDLMQAYYDLAITTFIDNVLILAIENCLLLPLESIFTSLTVNLMEDQQIKALASEPSFVQVDRELLNGELEKLQAALRTCSRYNTCSSRFKRPRVLGEGSQPKAAENGKAKVSKSHTSAQFSFPTFGGPTPFQNLFNVDANANAAFQKPVTFRAPTGPPVFASIGGSSKTDDKPDESGAFTASSDNQPVPRTPISGRNGSVSNKVVKHAASSISRFPIHRAASDPRLFANFTTAFDATEAPTTKFRESRQHTCEVEHGSGVHSHYQTITCSPFFAKYSLEELRLGDYARGDIKPKPCDGLS